MTYSEGDACSGCDVDHDLISPRSKSASLETVLMDNHTASCLCSNEIDFISRLHTSVKETTVCSCGGSPLAKLISVTVIRSALNAGT